MELGFGLIESVPGYHHFKTSEHTPVDSKSFMAAVYKEVCNVICDLIFDFNFHLQSVFL